MMSKRMKLSGNGTGNVENVANSKVIVVPKKLLTQEQGKLSIVQLRNPKTGKADFYLFNGSNENAFQLITFNEKCHSWFIDNSVQQDGNLVFATHIDPLFLVLPYLKQCMKFRPLDQIIVDSDFPECERLLHCLRLTDIQLISKLKENKDIKAYCYDEKKCLEWLTAKVMSMVEVLKQKKVTVGGAQSATFVRSRREIGFSEVDYLSYAHGIISDYLPADVSQSLRKHLNIGDDEQITDKLEPPSKIQKLDKISEGPLEDYSKGYSQVKIEMKQASRLSLAQKALSKVDKSGMKNISSFFSTKN